jgi:DNA-binding transcriptional ArsR family regulator
MTAPTPADDLWDQTASMAWTHWSELGASSWQRSPVPWAVEVEPLIVLTALIGERDHRLLREAIDWCATNERFVSLSQLRHVLASEGWTWAERMNAFSATVTRHTRRRWPGASEAEPYEIPLSGKSNEPDLTRPALLPLRLRAIFGVSARAEIVRALLIGGTPMTARQLTERVSYTRRQVELDLDLLAQARFVDRVSDAGPATYGLVERKALVAVVGEPPDTNLSWSPMVRVLTGVLHALEDLIGGSYLEPAIEVHRRTRELEDALRRSGLPAIPTAEGTAGMLSWAQATVTALAEGRLPTRHSP